MDLRRLPGRRPASGPDADSGAPAVPEQQTGGRTFEMGPGTPPDSPPTTGFVRPATGRGAEPATWRRQDQPGQGTAVPDRADPDLASPGRPVDPGRSTDPAWTPDAAPHRAPDTTGRGQPPVVGERRTTERQRPVEPEAAPSPDPDPDPSPSPDPDPDSGPAAEPVEDLGTRAGATRREREHRAAAPVAVAARGRDMALLALGGAVAAVAAFLPWSTLTSGDETRTFTGVTVGDGRLTLVAGLLMVLVGLASLRGRGRPAGGTGRVGPASDLLVARASALLLVIVSGFDLALGPPSLSSFRAISADVIAVRPQIGVVVTLVAGLVGLVAVARPRPRR
ncbi:hypothetical protein [Parafrankia discariae]|uniref:hypothetical protein n=1 Tax=Parafrankia discariae TaxID=365528 RepID=UPI0012B69699|nr:hypothetical protein [Parafrankia discariae]